MDYSPNCLGTGKINALHFAKKYEKTENGDMVNNPKSSGRVTKCPDSTPKVSSKMAGSSSNCRRIVGVLTVGVWQSGTWS